MLNVISTCWDILCVDINVDKRCVDHSTSAYQTIHGTTTSDSITFMTSAADVSDNFDTI